MKISKTVLFFIPITNSCLNSISPFPSLQRYNTNPVIPTNKQLTNNSQQNYTYKDYQSSALSNVPPKPIDNPPKQEPLTSIYTFPSLVKPTPNWRRPYQQQPTADGTSSAWRLFGVRRLLN